MSPKIIFDVSVVWTILGYVTEMREEINMGRRLNRGKKEGESTYKLLYIREKEMGTTTWKCEDIYRAFVRTGKRKHGMWLVSFTGIPGNRAVTKAGTQGPSYNEKDREESLQNKEG